MIGTLTFTDRISGHMTSSRLFPFSWADWPGPVGRSREGTPGGLTVPRMRFITPIEKEISTCQSTKVSLSDWEPVFTPRTDLGKRLYALRAKAVDAGMKLFTEDEILEEVKRRRGEIEEDEKDLY